MFVSSRLASSITRPVSRCALPALLALLASVTVAAAVAPTAVAQPTAAAPMRDGTLPRVSPSASVSQTFGVTMASVAYGRPSARGRTLYGTNGIVPDGQVWRAGADEATTITFSSDVRVEDEALPAGTYGLFAIPEGGGTAWTVIFNRTARQWGAFQYDAAQDALRVRVTGERIAPALDRFTVGFDAPSDTSTVLTLAWGDVRVPVRIAAHTAALLRAKADAAAASATDWRQPFRYAQYALTNRVMLDAGALWAARAATLEANYATMRLRALYAAETGDLAAAAAAGEEALRLGRAQATAPQGLAEFATRVAGWRAGTR